ncbi:hypothetical protein CDL12_05972 [Handroanthus impetiginosus]|uniref:Uncharacterized protein n=1 Tax=Handroanthus impetiginosus TaxID=429701 RepID=A0A2G9HUY9_9LAMI|nr:hypothetical protein CDL12_05972 [Handroanthus impetiginosus]
MATAKFVGTIVRVLLICFILLQAAETKYISYDALRIGDPTNLSQERRVPPVEAPRLSSRRSLKMQRCEDETG